MFQQVAQLAPTLKEAELRTLLYLTSAALARGATSIRASSRQIAAAAKIARSSVVEALDDLTARGLIATRQGTSTSAAAYALRFLEVTTMGGPAAGPPPRSGGPTDGPPVDLFADHPGPIAGPPPTENEALPAAPSTLDIEPRSIKTIDRVLTADPKAFERGQLGKVRDLISYAAAKAHHAYDAEPDFRVCAQIFEACGRSHDALEWLVLEMHRSRHSPGASPSWWVTVALQRFHSIDYKTTTARRAELRATKRPTLVRDGAAAQQENSDAPSAAEIERAIAAAAASKKL